MPEFHVWHKRGDRYYKAAVVEAGNVEAAAILTAFRVERWHDHPEIKPELGYHRSTTFGDIIIDPGGEEYSFEVVKVGGDEYPGFTKVNTITEQLHAEFIAVGAIEEARSIGIDLTVVAGPLDAGRNVTTGFNALTEEIRADEYAARVGDYGPEDAATHERRVEDGAEMPVTQWRPEFGRMMEAIANPQSSYDKMLDDVANRGVAQETGKDGPER